MAPRLVHEAAVALQLGSREGGRVRGQLLWREGLGAGEAGEVAGHGLGDPEAAGRCVSKGSRFAWPPPRGFFIQVSTQGLLLP